MKRLVKLSLIAAIALGSQLGFSAEQLLTKATVQGENRELKFLVKLDENKDIKSLRFVDYLNNKLNDERPLDINEIQNGVIIFQKRGKTVIDLSSSNFSEHQGGELVFDYLVNGITGRRGKFIVDVSRDGDQWVMSAKGQQTKHIHILVNKKRFLGPIGIRNIEIR